MLLLDHLARYRQPPDSADAGSLVAAGAVGPHPQAVRAVVPGYRVEALS